MADPRASPTALRAFAIGVLIGVVAFAGGFIGGYSGGSLGGSKSKPGFDTVWGAAGVPVKVEVIPSSLQLHSGTTPPPTLTLAINTPGAAATVTISWDLDVFEQPSPQTYTVPSGSVGSYALTVKPGASGTVTIKTTTTNSAGVPLSDTDVVKIVNP